MSGPLLVAQVPNANEAGQTLGVAFHYHPEATGFNDVWFLADMSYAERAILAAKPDVNPDDIIWKVQAGG